MGPNNNRKNVIGSVIIALALLTFWVLVMPERKKIGEFNDAIQLRQTDLDDRVAIDKKIRDINKRAEDRAIEIKNLGLIVPSKKDVAELISAMDRIATISGMQLAQINIQPQPDTPNDPFNGLTVTADVSGEFGSIKNFLENLEQNIRLLDVDSVQLAPTSETLTSVLNVSIQARAYFLK